jgi:nuclear GTP-binding protein
LKKDLGIPNLFPLKDKVLQEIEQRRQNAEQERETKRRAHDESTGEMQVEESGIVKLVHEARERGVQFEEDMLVDEGDFEGEKKMATKKDVSRKTYNKEFKKVVEQADVVLYVLDARDPDGTRSKEIENMIRESPNGEKQLLLILNKVGNDYFCDKR